MVKRQITNDKNYDTARNYDLFSIVSTVTFQQEDVTTNSLCIPTYIVPIDTQMGVHMHTCAHTLSYPILVDTEQLLAQVITTITIDPTQSESQLQAV